MNIKYLISFLTVADAGSINTAALQMFISPSALMKQINSVEGEVGTALLIRGKKGVMLTEAGAAFYAGLKDLLPAYEELVKKTKQIGARSGQRIVIGSWSVACHCVLPQIINYFQLRHPDVELVFRNIPGIEEMQRALEQREIDATFSFGGRSRATARLDYITLAREEPLLLIPSTCNIRMKREYTLDDFEGSTLVVTDGSVSGWFDQFNQYVQKYFPSIRLYTTSENESGLMDMQRLAVPCVASRSIIPRDSSYLTVPLKLPEDFDDPLISIDLICRRGDDPKIQEFVQSAQEAARIIWFSSRVR